MAGKLVALADYALTGISVTPFGVEAATGSPRCAVSMIRTPD
jgi:hypothetical protein